MIRITDLTRMYGSFTAVDRMSLVIPEGSVFGLLGPNGAGKTTTVKCIAGLLRPTSGKILVDDIDVAENPMAVKAALGYVPESPAMFRTLSGRELMTLVGRLHRMNEEELARRAGELLESFGLGGKADEQVQSYSKGMTQKLAIAAALLPNPRVLILDEALNGLDASSAAVLKQLIRGLADAGKTVVFCSHILEVVERICDDIAIVAQGRVRAQGTVSAIMAENPMAVKAALGYVPESPALFRTLSGRELMTLVGRLHRMNEGDLARRAGELLESFGLGGKADDQVQSYSKGMTQKLAIAAALLPNPRVLILDEALNGLDASSAAVLKQLIRGLADAGKTVVFCSHILEVVERLCDDIAIVAQGRVRAQGTVSAIMTENHAATLEEAFIRLTGETDVAREASEILAALGGSAGKA
jgi:ABC-2 type transport system ATP-binding protein